MICRYKTPVSPTCTQLKIPSTRFAATIILHRSACSVGNSFDILMHLCSMLSKIISPKNSEEDINALFTLPNSSNKHVHVPEVPKSNSQRSFKLCVQLRGMYSWHAYITTVTGLLKGIDKNNLCLIMHFSMRNNFSIIRRTKKANQLGRNPSSHQTYRGDCK
jgi:hypothetical protein